MRGESSSTKRRSASGLAARKLARSSSSSVARGWSVHLQARREVEHLDGCSLAVAWCSPARPSPG